MAELLPVITALDVHSVRACMAGRATPDQQIAAMKWIMEQACRRYDSPYIPGSNDLDTGVLLGRHLAGVYINQMASPATLKKAQAFDAAALKPQGKKP